MTAPVSSTDLARRGDQLLNDGLRNEAISFYRASLAINPASPDTWYNLAWAYRANRLFDCALEAYGKALVHGVRQPEEALLNRAAILADHLYQPDTAEVELKSALTISPTFVPALLNLGILYEDLGRAEPARDAYQRILAQAPENGRARARLAMIDLAEGNIDQALGTLATGLPIVNTPVDRAELLYAKAAALDADQRFDAAFETLGAANILARQNARSRYDPHARERLVDRLIKTFCAPRAMSNVQSGKTVEPIFIAGMFRSGSTLVEQILSRHSPIVAGGELEFIPALAEFYAGAYPEAVAEMGVAEIEANRSAYLRELARLASTGWVTDKRCDNIFHIGLIKSLFPEAYIVHTVRHPLDTLVSVLFLHFGEGVAYGHDQRDVAHYYIHYRRMLDHWRTLYGDTICDVHYDRLVVDPRAEIEPLLHSMGMKWEATTAYAGDARPVRTASSWQVRKAIHLQSLGRWQRYAKHLEPARHMLADAGLL